MLHVFWSTKGGSGTTTTAASYALLLARQAEVLVVDLAGDMPAALGLPDPVGPGVVELLDRGHDFGDYQSCEVPAPGGMRLIPAGYGPLPTVCDAPAEARAVAVLGADGREVVVDAGTNPRGLAMALAALAPRSFLVLRPCYLGLRRAGAFPLRPSRVLLVDEPDRTIRPEDVASVVDAEVTVLPWSVSLSRAVDVGSLSGRAPRAFARALQAMEVTA